MKDSAAVPVVRKKKYFIYSDESGSWHDDKDVYVRSWLVFPENEEVSLDYKMTEALAVIGANELKWVNFVKQIELFKHFNDLNFKVFITVSSPSDINWKYYMVLRDFESNIGQLNFGGLDLNLVEYIKDRVHRDIKNALFLNYYERLHIENAKKAIELVIKPLEYDLIYRVDPPQMSQEKWGEILKGTGGQTMNIEFPRSHKSHGIQLADVIAGCVRSLLEKDSNYENACLFLKQIKGKLINKSVANPNPNLIYFQEINEALKGNCAAIWRL